MFLKLDNIVEIAFPSFPAYFLFLTLTTEFGKGFTETNLKYMRQFYLTYPDFLDKKRYAVRSESEKGHALRDESTKLIGNFGFMAYEIATLTEFTLNPFASLKINTVNVFARNDGVD